MFEVQITPAHGLKQTVDYALPISFPPEYGITIFDSARMDLRYDLLDAFPVDTLTRDNNRIDISVGNDGTATVTLLLNGENSRGYPLKTDRGVPLFRKLTADEVPASFTRFAEYLVLPLFGTLILTSPSGMDRPGSMDLNLLFEVSYTR